MTDLRYCSGASAAETREWMLWLQLAAVGQSCRQQLCHQELEQSSNVLPSPDAQESPPPAVTSDATYMKRNIPSYPPVANVPNMSRDTGTRASSFSRQTGREGVVLRDATPRGFSAGDRRRVSSACTRRGRAGSSRGGDVGSDFEEAGAKEALKEAMAGDERTDSAKRRQLGTNTLSSEFKACVEAVRQACEEENYKLVGVSSNVRLSVQHPEKWEWFGSQKRRGRLESMWGVCALGAGGWLFLWLFVAVGCFLTSIVSLIGLLVELVQVATYEGSTQTSIWTKVWSIMLMRHPQSHHSLGGAALALPRSVLFLAGRATPRLLRQVVFPWALGYLAMTRSLMKSGKGVTKAGSSDSSGAEVLAADVGGPAVKGTCIVEAGAGDVLTVLMDCEKSAEWMVGGQGCRRFDAADANNDYVLDYFHPAMTWGGLNTAMRCLGLSEAVALRSLCLRRWWGILPDGSYLVLRHTCTEADTRLERAIAGASGGRGKNSGIRNSSNDRREKEAVWKGGCNNHQGADSMGRALSPAAVSAGEQTLLLGSSTLDNLDKRAIAAKGFESFVITSLDEQRSCVIYLASLHLGGSMPDWAKELCIMGRVQSLSALSELAVASLAVQPTLQVRTMTEDVNENESDISRSAAPSYSRSGCDLLSDISGAETGQSTSPLAGFVRVPQGGLRCVDQAVIEKQKGVLLELLKSAGRALLSGSNIVGVSLPVRIFEPKSLLEKIVDSWSFAPKLLSIASSVGDDPLQRFKYCIAFAVSTLHLSCYQLKPFNPTLGETFQAEWEDGTAAFVEHTSHQPPVSHFMVRGGVQRFCMHGHYEFHGQLKGNNGIARQDGYTTVDFPDGGQVRWTLPVAKLSGLIWGHRIFEWLGQFTFEDSQNSLACTLSLCPEPKTFFGSAKAPSDTLEGKILHCGSEVSSVGGSWLEKVTFDGQT